MATKTDQSYRKDHLSPALLQALARQVVLLPRADQTHLAQCGHCRMRLDWTAAAVDAARSQGWKASPRPHLEVEVLLDQWLDGDLTPAALDPLAKLLRDVPVCRDLAQVMVAERLTLGMDLQVDSLQAQIGCPLFAEGISPITLEPEAVPAEEAPEDIQVFDTELELAGRPRPGQVEVKRLQLRPLWTDTLEQHWQAFRQWFALSSRGGSWATAGLLIAGLAAVLLLVRFSVPSTGDSTPVSAAARPPAHPTMAPASTPSSVATRGDAIGLQNVRAQRFRFVSLQSLEPVGLLSEEPVPCQPGERLHFSVAPVGEGYLSLWERAPNGQLRILSSHPRRQYVGGEVEVSRYSPVGVGQGDGAEPSVWPEVPARGGVWAWQVIFSSNTPPLEANAEWLERQMDANTSESATFRCQVRR